MSSYLGISAPNITVPGNTAIMSEVKIDGSVTHIQGNICYQFATWAIARLVGNRAPMIKCRITFTDDVVRERRWGDINALDIKKRFPVEFHMRVAATSPDLQEQMRIIGHEITHIKHMTTGELRFLTNNRVSWRDVIYNSEDYEPWFEPWEIDARGHEKGLYESFVNEMKYNRQPWYKITPY